MMIQSYLFVLVKLINRYLDYVFKFDERDKDPCRYLIVKFLLS